MIESPTNVDSSNDVELNPIRWTLIVAATLIILFAPGDLAILPDIVQPEYLTRTLLQCLLIMFYFLFSFHASFLKYQQITLLFLVILITYLNYYFIYVCWVNVSFAFPYEGVLLYSFFSLFIMRLNFSLSIVYVLTNVVGFAVLIVAYPIYGIFNVVNLGFVTGSQLIGLYGSYRLLASTRRSHKLTEYLKLLSRTDQLTGLLNRRAYEEEAAKLLSLCARSNINLSVFLIDIDDFKVFNDTYGHIEGDEVIRIQSDILLNCFKRQSDIVGRYGGEEFVIFASDMDMEKLLEMGQDLLNGWAIRKIENKHSRSESHVTCSLGIYSAVPGIDSNIHEFIQQADEALYLAKDSGRNSVKIIRK